MKKQNKGQNTPILDYTPSINRLPDGSLDYDYYYNASMDIIERNMEADGRDPLHITSNQLQYYLDLCYISLFKPDNTTGKKPNNILYGYNTAYNPDDIKTLIEVYIRICAKYDALPSIVGASYYTGIDEETIRQYDVTPGGLGIGKRRKNYIQNRLNNTPIGVMTLANNDIETGLLYTRQNIVTHEAVKRSLSFDDLKRLADNGGNGSNNC